MCTPRTPRAGRPLLRRHAGNALLEYILTLGAVLSVLSVAQWLLIPNGPGHGLFGDAWMRLYGRLVSGIGLPFP